MKTIFTIIGVAIAATLLFFVFGGSTADAPTDTATSSDNAATTTSTSNEESTELEDGTYTINTEASTVLWTAEKSFVDGYQDSGFIPVSGGSVQVTNGTVASSSITLNVAEITATETSNTSVGVDRLSEHLRSDDFFATDEYPTASFTLTNVSTTSDNTATHEITGDLTIKGETNEISFPVTITGNNDGSLKVVGDTVIDRTEWNIRFRSPSFFNDLGDSAIADEVSITIDLVAEASEN